MRRAGPSVQHAAASLLAVLVAGCSDPPPDHLQGYAEGEYVRVASPFAGQLVTLDGSSSLGQIVRYEWDLDGNGSFERQGGPLTTTTFSDPGTHVIGLRVTEEEEREGLDITAHGETAYSR